MSDPRAGARSGGKADRLARIGTILAYGYALALVALFIGIAVRLPSRSWWSLGGHEELVDAILLTLGTSTIATALALLIAVPTAWSLSRGGLRGQSVIDVLLDMPLSLSPLVMGLAFLLFFTSPPGRWIEDACGRLGLRLRGGMSGVILTQVAIATAFAIRTLRGAFDGLDAGLTDADADWRSILRRMWARKRQALLVAATITWARTIGEFGPLLLFVGIIPHDTEVLSTAIYLSWASGDLEGAAMAACLMMALSFAVVLLVRHLGRASPRTN